MGNRAGIARARLPPASVRDLERRLATAKRRGGSQHETKRSRRPSLLADHVSEVVVVNPQLEASLGADVENLDLDVLGMVHQAPCDQGDDITEALIFGVGLATRRAAQRGAGGAVPSGTDDSFSPARRKRVIHRPNNRSAGPGWLSLRTATPLTQRATPLSHTRSTVVV